jgi:hypothetical protein
MFLRKELHTDAAQLTTFEALSYLALLEEQNDKLKPQVPTSME